jgi:hypothetical protein
MKLMTSKPVEFSKKLFENEEYGENCGWSGTQQQHSGDTNGEETTTTTPKKRQRERASNRLEMFLVSICV